LNLYRSVSARVHLLSTLTDRLTPFTTSVTIELGVNGPDGPEAVTVVVLVFVTVLVTVLVLPLVPLGASNYSAPATATAPTTAPAPTPTMKFLRDTLFFVVASSFDVIIRLVLEASPFV
jgi:hypothetical protein